MMLNNYLQVLILPFDGYGIESAATDGHRLAVLI